MLLVVSNENGNLKGKKVVGTFDEEYLKKNLKEFSVE